VERVRILITSAGAGPGVAVIKALMRQTELAVHVIAADMDKTAAGLYLADEYVIVPPVTQEGEFYEFIVGHCRENEVDFVIPIFDLETPFFSKHREELEEQTGAKILVCDHEVIEISNDKIKSHEHCIKNGIKVPKIYTDDEIAQGEFAFPLIRKPRYGIGTKGVVKISSEKELQVILPLDKDDFLQRFIGGKEYTIDSISDFSGRCLAALPRLRKVVKAGQTVKGVTTRDERLIEYGKRVADVFGIKGAGCSQCVVAGDEIYFIEMNPRYGTGISLSIGAGLNIPLLHLKLALGMEISAGELEFKDNWVMTRYWEEIFLDGSEIWDGAE